MTLIYVIHGIDEVCKNAWKEALLFLFSFQCMNADVDVCIRERKKRVLPGLELVTMVALIDLLCLKFSIFPWCCHFYLLIDVVVDAYCMLWNYSSCYILMIVILVVLLSERFSPFRTRICFNLHSRISLQSKIKGFAVSADYVFLC